MKKGWKIVAVIAAIILVLIIIYFFVKKSYKAIPFLDNGQAGTLVQGKGYSGELAFMVDKNEKVDLKVGDTIMVVQDAGFKYPEYNGEKKVKAVELGTNGDRGDFSNYIIVITDDYYIKSSPVNAGTMTKTNVF